MSDSYAEDKRWARDLAERLVAAARDAGAEAADATAGVGSSLSAKARDGAIEDITRSSYRAAGVRVIVDGKLGFATAASAPRDPEEIRELAKAAVDLARIASPSPHNVIPEATAPTGDVLEREVKKLALWDEGVANVEAGWAATQSLAMEKILRETDGISTVREVGAGARRSVFALATSTGFSGSYGGTMASASASGVAEDQGGKKQVDGWWTAGRKLQDLDDPETVAREAARRVLAKVGARKIPTCRVPVIYDPQMSRGFFAAVLGALNGDSISRDASFLAGKKGEVVLVPGISMLDDPTLVGGLASRPFDGEGQRVHPVTLIDEQGRLASWLLDARSAHKLGEPITGHASRGATSLPGPSSSNVLITGGHGDLDSIVAETKRGLLVTSLLGHSPDMITGEYSRGASGFWIEDGAIAHPVEEITVAGDMLAMMRGMDRIGDDPDRRSSLLAPTIRFAELQVSGA